MQLIRPWLSCVREVVAAEVRWLDRKSASTIKQFLGGDGVSFGERDEMGEAERAGECVCVCVWGGVYVSELS